MTGIYTPTREDLERRVARFDRLQPMSTARDLGWTPQTAMDIIFARKLMPVILDDSDWDTWLDPAFKERGRLRAMLEPRVEPELAIRAVSQLVNNVRNDGPELVVPI